jgi:hypothetical protein
VESEDAVDSVVALVAEVGVVVVDAEGAVDVAGEEKKTKNGYRLPNWAVL